MKLHDNVREIYEYAKSHPDEFKDVELLIQMRYMDAVLSNRAGSAPNKTNDVKIIKETCLMPYTDMFIFRMAAWASAAAITLKQQHLPIWTRHL